MCEIALKYLKMLIIHVTKIIKYFGQLEQNVEYAISKTTNFLKIRFKNYHCFLKYNNKYKCKNK